MKVEAQWRGPGRLLLITGVQPGEAEALLDSLGVEEAIAPLPNVDAVGWAVGFEGGVFFPPIHHWFFQGRSACRRWQASRVSGPFLPTLTGEACNGCERAA